MSFHVYVEPELQDRLAALCRETGRKRNAVVRAALRDYIDRAQPKKNGWPAGFFDFEPDPDMPPFESYRSELLPPREFEFGDADA